MMVEKKQNNGNLLFNGGHGQLDGADEDDDRDNDEENIVIDLADEDEDEDEDEEQHFLQQQAEPVAAEQFAQPLEANAENPIVLPKFNVGDLVWFDPNQLGYSIPGKVIDYYPDLTLLTVEGYSQVELVDHENNNTINSNGPVFVKQHDDQTLQIYDLSDPTQFKSLKRRLPLINESGLSDLIELEELSIESLIYNLKLRYKQDFIYTSCGHKILISVNPNKQPNDLYNLNQVNKYNKSLNTSNLKSLRHNKNGTGIDHFKSINTSLVRWLLLNDDPTPHSNQEPHIFKFANEALKRLLTSGQDQCFILLGESGSGKSEVNKLLLQYLVTINKSPSNSITEQILESLQLLESFGNAKTVLNHNSSRYGKLIDIKFDLFSGFIKSAKIIELNLLDRTRIVSQCELERNYHIFYELLSGLNDEEKEKYGLQSAEKYFYLNQGHEVRLQTKDDNEDFKLLLSSMQILGFNYEEQDTIFRLLASILHLGNIYFHRKVLAVRSGIKSAIQSDYESNNGIEGVEIGSDTEVRWVSHLLQIQFESVMKCLTVRTTETTSGHSMAYMKNNLPGKTMNADRIITPLNIDQALDTRDAIARTLYSCLFKWLVQRVNAMIDIGADEDGYVENPAQKQPANEPIYLCQTSESLCEFQPDKLAHSQTSSKQSSLARKSTSSGYDNSKRQATMTFLDCFGFENLGENNFEQLCINYSAELLQYHTFKYLVRLEQAEYLKEKLRWQPITNTSNNFDSLRGSDGLSNQATSNHNNHPASIVNLISKKPLGILALLDDECNFPKATDQSFVEKCHHNHTLNDNYQRARLISNCQEFGIKHFGQPNRLVWYQVDGFIEKNRESLRPDILELLLNSKMIIVSDMLRKMHHPAGDYSTMSNSNSFNSSTMKTLSRTYDGRLVTMKPRATSVAAKFQDAIHNNRALRSIQHKSAGQSTGSLNGNQQTAHNMDYVHYGYPMNQLKTKPNPWFIICIKPNQFMKQQIAQLSNFDVAYVQEQLKSLSLLELVKLRKLGYPVRLRYGEFVRRYKCLVPQKFQNNLASCQEIQAANRKLNKQRNQQTVNKSTSEIKRAIRSVCSSIIEYRFQSDIKWVRSQYQCGLSKMFLNERLYQICEEMRLKEYQLAILNIQKTYRMWSIRREFLLRREAAIMIQKAVRGYLARIEFFHQYMLIINLQRRWRQYVINKRRVMFEAKRRAQKQQQLFQLQELQAQQRKQANQFRYRQVNQQKLASGNQATGNYAKISLDIPNDLAQLYRLQRDWVPVHELSHLNEIKLPELINRELMRLKKHRGNHSSVPFITLDQDEMVGSRRRLNDLFADRVYLKDLILPSTAEFKAKLIKILDDLDSSDQYCLQNLIQTYYTIESPQFGYSRLPITKAFNLKIEPSLGKKFKLAELKAITMYKLILRFIDSDLDNSQQAIIYDHGNQMTMEQSNIYQMNRLTKFKLISDYIIFNCSLDENGLLIDEVFLQLISLLWQNPKPKSSENVWKLMLNCLNCFKPFDKDLTKFLLKYVNDYCMNDDYRQMILERLGERLIFSKQLTRMNPPTMLEYWANQKLIDKLALAASCYMDDYSLNGLNDNDENNGGLASLEELSTTNHSNKTLVLLKSPSQTTAEQLAISVLKARNVPHSNLFGWSAEIQHEGSLDVEFSCRLRGDDQLLDHLSRVELLPEFADLIKDENDAIMEQIRATTNKQKLNNKQPFAPMPVHHRHSVDMSHRSSMVSNSFASQSRRNSARVSESDLLNSYHSQYQQNKLSQTGKLNKKYAQYHQQQVQQMARYPADDQYQQSLMNRRSMSMQELQLASSALNGRYFSNNNNVIPPPSSHYASSHVTAQPQTRRSQTPNSMTMTANQNLNRMSSSAYGSSSYAQSSYMAASCSEADYQQQQRQTRGSRNKDRSSGNSSLQRAPKQRRSASSTSRQTPQRLLNDQQHMDPYYGSGAGLTTGGSTHSNDYERIGGRQQAFRNPSKARPAANGGAMMQQVRPQNPLVERYKKQPTGRLTKADYNFRDDMSSASMRQPNHYVQSSAMSDTSEAPSLASHVRGIKVPQHNADLDQYLDDLFNPLLDDAELDEMSDARSLATSIRGYENLCNPASLAKIIRGTDDEQENKQRGDTLSPTFETLLNSLRSEPANVLISDEQNSQALSSSPTKQPMIAELSSMNLSELKALNEKLENEIQVAQSKRPSLELLHADQSTLIPAPPPQPVFDQPSIGALDDIYSRAKTIRIGKWRWPPAQDEAGVAEAGEFASTAGATAWESKIINHHESQEKKRQSLLSNSSSELNEQEASVATSEANEQPSQQVAAVDLSIAATTNVGKLKISSEMKAKLEQLTNSSQSSSTQRDSQAGQPTASGIVSQAKSLLLENLNSSNSESVSKLNEQRRNLLEKQLIGGGGTSMTSSNRSSLSTATPDLMGGKILAAKQQLAAAAGVALAALDSSTPNSQASSRRQSAQVLERLENGMKELKKSQRLSIQEADELGPKSKSAISNREAFYHQLNQDDQDEVAPAQIIPAPVQPKATGAEVAAEKEAKRQQVLSSLAEKTRKQEAESKARVESEIYGQSIAKSLSQRQHESLEKAKRQASNKLNEHQWVSSSPDPTLRQDKARKYQKRAPSSASSNQQDQVLAPSTVNKKITRPLQAVKRKEEVNYQDQLTDLTMSETCLVYANVDWQIKIRKEFFLPSETYDDLLVIQLIFAQLVADVFNPRHWTRLNSKERAAIKSLMKDNSIGYSPKLPQIGEMTAIKKDLVKMARSFGLYFTRSYQALNYALQCDDDGAYSLDSSGGSSDEASSPTENDQFSAKRARKLMDRLKLANNLGLEWIDLVAVHHSGLRLVSVVPSTDRSQQQFGYKVLETLKYRDMVAVSQVARNVLLVSMRNGKKCWLLSSIQATQLGTLLNCFHADYNEHLSSGSTPAISSQQAKANLQHQHQHQQQAKAATTKKQQQRAEKDALLATDDDHYGDHFKQRQAADSVHELRPAAHSNNDLVDSERVLPDHLATAGQQDDEAGCKQRSKRHALPGDADSGPSDKPAVVAGKAASDFEPAQPDELADPIEQSYTHDHGGKLKQSPAGVAIEAPNRNQEEEFEEFEGELLEDRPVSVGDQTRAPASRQDKKGKSSIWQNSLSRMSNKFSIFSGAGGTGSSSKQDKKAKRQPQIVHQQESQPIALDSWIETKVDFEEDDDGRSSAATRTSQSNRQAGDESQSSLPSSATTQSSSRDPQSIGDQQTAGKAEDGKYSLLQFALYNFREAIDKYSLESRANKANQSAGDTSTLRGSLKLIETLRGGSHSSAHQHEQTSSRRSILPDHNNRDWTWRELAEMVKFTSVPPKQSLLKLPSDDLNKRALDCFAAIMQYMGDLPMQHNANSKQEGEVECVYLILMNCHNFPILRDEVYCQLMKQTTNNRSLSNQDSCLKGWRLFSITAAYFDCSPSFKPYLLKYLETAAYDKRRAYCSIATICLQNLRKTFRYHGRKNVPSIEEIAATTAGRNSKRQIYRLPGGTERVINTKSTTVVEDIIHEICLNMLNVTDPDEMLEFSLYCIADGDLYTMPLNRDEYILDITTELIKNHQQYFLIFCRSIWHYPLHLDSKLYIEVIFNQIAPDYLEGLLLVLPNSAYCAAQSRYSSNSNSSNYKKLLHDNQEPLRLKMKLVKELARIAALLHRASGTEHMPHKDEIKYLLPKPIIAAMKLHKQVQQMHQGESRPPSDSQSELSQNQIDTVITSPSKWIDLVQNNWREMSAFDELDAKAQFLDIVRHWPLFGSSFFAIKLIQRDLIQTMDFILALNKLGIQMLDIQTHETIYKYPFNEVISTRKVRSEDGSLFLDLKCGNLMKRTIIRIQTDQAHEISRLIRQYIDIELLQQKTQQPDHLGTSVRSPQQQEIDAIATP